MYFKYLRCLVFEFTFLFLPRIVNEHARRVILRNRALSKPAQVRLIQRLIEHWRGPGTAAALYKTGWYPSDI